ncbi:N-acetyltransferase [Erythrobacter vulgaris]|uniref:N-acetyltransferase n=1 Tax=Qipengyuania vulgaris TaxID=291985 RepID=A0A844XRV1_9SPHN|nr:N-acetyltransferase [Qipengyuania vulgaris]
MQVSDADIVIEPVEGKQGRATFVDLGREFAAREAHSIPQLRSEQLELIDPEKNPFFGHATVQLFIACREGKPVGRIAAHIDHLALELPAEQGMGPSTGMFGYFDAEDENVSRALLSRAEEWLREKGMTRMIGPLSLSIWEEPGLLVKGQDHPPMIMMGHHPAHYADWIESGDFTVTKRLFTYDLDITSDFPKIVQRIVASGERNERIRIRPIEMKRWEEEIRVVLHILNDAWSDNWGFVPFTEAEIDHAAKKMKPIIKPRLNMIAELDGRPVAFMMVLPDINEVLKKVDGRLFPFGWFHLLRWLRKPMGAGLRVPLMGVLKEFQNSRIASQLAFMMIEHIRRNALSDYGSRRSEIGWILDDNKGMIAIADTIGSSVNREYVIYEKAIGVS